MLVQSILGRRAEPEPDVLLPQRQVEAVLVTQRLDVFRPGAVPKVHHHGIARHEVDEQKHQRHHGPHYRQDNRHALEKREEKRNQHGHQASDPELTSANLARQIDARRATKQKTRQGGASKKCTTHVQRLSRAVVS